LTPSDEDLLRDFANGDRRALGVLAERYERLLLSLACAILGSRDVAVDAVQETWLRVIRYAAGYNGRSSVKTWLHRIVINQCRTLLSARPAATGEEPARTPGAKRDPAAEAARQDESEQLKRAVETLSPPLRETVLLCYTHGLTHEEAAEAMDVPVGTVKSRLHAALEQLRMELQARGANGPA